MTIRSSSEWTFRAAVPPGTYVSSAGVWMRGPLPRIRIPGEHTRDRGVLVGILAEILNDQRPGHKVAAMFIDTAFGAPIYERLRSLGFTNVHEVNFGQTHTPDRTKANMRAYMWDQMKDWLLKGAIESDEKMAADLAGPGYGINGEICWSWNRGGNAEAWSGEPR